MPEYNEPVDAITKTAQGIIDYVASAPSHELPPVDVLAAYIRATTFHAELVKSLEWYIKNDDASEDDGYYMAGQIKARSVLAKIKGE